MPSLVPDYIINPVLRQARRLSSNFNSPGPETPLDQPLGSSDLDSSTLDDDEIVGPSQGPQQAGGALGGQTTAQGPSGLSRLFASARTFTSSPSANTSAAESPTQQEQDQEDQLVSGSGTAVAALSTSAPQGQHAHRRSNAAEIGLEDPFGLLNVADGAGEHTGGAGQGSLGMGTPASLPTGFYGNIELPEDDGMQALRRRILAVQSRDIAAEDKAKMMHSLLMESYQRSRKPAFPLRPVTPSSPPATAASIRDEAPASFGPLESLKFWHAAYSHGTPLPQTQTFSLTEDDIRPTYVPDANVTGDGIARDEEGRQLLGCEHYRRNVKLQCDACERWYTCRLCHNDAEEHVLPRRDTKHMLCMLCGHAQRAGDVCANCGESAARYFCSICKLWNDDPDKSIYHCNDCGICRVGEGLGKDFFHCKKCGSCIAINQEESHRCREGVMDCDCPICGEYIFTTHKKVVTMKCGHMIHDDCRAEYIKRSYKCPICNKSVENMESMFRRLDKHLEEQPMPEEYANTRAVILCNDCEAKTSTTYHWGGLRCEVCLSYNTVELLLLNLPATHNGQNAAAETGQSAPEDASDAAGKAATEGSTAVGSQLGIAAHSALQPAPSVPSTPLSSSPRPDSGIALAHPRSPPLMSFRSASPAFMTSPTRAPVLATAPPGYSEEGFQLEGDEDDYQQSSDMEDGDILGLFDRHAALSWGRRKVSPYFGGGKKDDSDADNDDDEDDDDDDDDDEDENNDEDEEEDDDDDEEPIQLFGHR
ncbi:chy and ring finger domain protein [Sporothrix brasiliensis 5110]|uniref:Chy and ring finger domain protein n=1 Tax=Sporothrix brasiliensis 5110 TaxID=1398154 RepID=A0A0C2EXX7_9PEZI|nr:chy and ring finger domain protein [Sporothrix brasiliensis 5110]KIH91539.1 chy and ring finger domain protein [Sporothrix brasiliensis 5110]